LIDPTWYLLLLPVAAASGWLAARRQVVNKVGNQKLPDAYFAGLNFLVNEQPDKAIEVFVKVLEVAPETIEVHLALGNLFRRRGELERATTIHQNLLVKTRLNREQHMLALYELGRDYYKAGWFDRAEGLFQELSEYNEHAATACHYLQLIYEREREWRKADQAARRLMKYTNEDLQHVIAHYWCEIAEQSFEEQDLTGIRQGINRALATNQQSVRAIMLSAKMHFQSGEYRKALRAWRRCGELAPELQSEIIAGVVECYRALHDPDTLAEYLQNLALHNSSGRVLSQVLEYLREIRGGKAAEMFLLRHLRQYNTAEGLWQLLQFRRSQGCDQDAPYSKFLGEFLQMVLRTDRVYICQHCGFSSKRLNWQCPSCRYWDSMRPVQDPQIPEVAGILELLQVAGPSSE